MKFLTVILSLLCCVQLSFAQLHIRYNQKGYHLQQDKKIVILSDKDVKNTAWKLLKPDGSVALEGKLGNSVESKGDYIPTNFSYIVDISEISEENNYTFSVDEQNVQITIQDYIYRTLTYDILRTFKVRRSGTSDVLDHKISHTGDKKCMVYERDGIDNTKWIKSSLGDVDMLGGWYDAGDYIKFTLTTAFSAYFLLKSYETDPSLFNTKHLSKSDYVDILDEAKYGLDYLLKTYPNENTFIIQVGGYQDHNVGERLPENDDLDGYREAYHSFSQTHMGYTAAALALGAKQFEDIDGILAKTYKEKAIAIFAKAESNDAVNHSYWKGNSKPVSIPKSNGKVILPPTAPNKGNTGYETYYADNTHNDNMALAAIELFRATNDSTYLTKAITYANSAGAAYWRAWASVNMNVHNYLLTHNSNSSNYLKVDLNYFRGISEKTNNLWNLPHNTTWGTMHSYVGVANAIAEYQLTTKDNTYESIFIDVVDYALGKNNWGISFLASKRMTYTADQNYATIYKLQDLFPTGEMSSGPTTSETMASQGFTGTTKEATFNTSATTFFNDKKNYVTMESIITGQAEALYLFSLASKLLSTTDIDSSTLSTIKSTNNEIQIFPNPTQGTFYVQLNQINSGLIEISDVTGKIIHTKRFSNIQKVDIKTQLPTGNYLIKISTNHQSFTKKIIIK